MKFLSAIDPQLNLTYRIVQLPKLGDGKGGIGEYTAWKVDDLLISRKMMDFISGREQIEGIPDEICIGKTYKPRSGPESPQDAGDFQHLSGTDDTKIYP